MRLVGPPGVKLGGAFDLDALPPLGSEPGVLLVGASDDTGVLPDTVPDVFFLPGALERGTHAFMEVWDGTSGLYGGGMARGYTFRVHDVSGDGVPDVWHWDRVIAGPLLGRAHGEEGVVTVAPGDHGVVHAGFDADGDGNEDVLVCATGGFVIRYGPFAPGVLPSVAGGEVTDDQITRLLGSCSGGEVVTRLPDLLGPGRDVVAQAAFKSAALFELSLPRGRQQPGPLAEFQASKKATWVFQPVGDVDGDGHDDFLATQDWGSEGVVLAGPPARHTDLVHWWELDLLIAFPDPTGLQQPGWAIGDLNGDGIDELTVGALTDSDLYHQAISFSPHAQSLDASQTLPVTQRRLAPQLGELHVDVDGDGLQDILATYTNPTSDQAALHPDLDPTRFDTTEILIWYGADLLAAENARRGALDLDPFPR